MTRKTPILVIFYSTWKTIGSWLASHSLIVKYCKLLLLLLELVALPSQNFLHYPHLLRQALLKSRSLHKHLIRHQQAHLSPTTNPQAK